MILILWKNIKLLAVRRLKAAIGKMDQIGRRNIAKNIIYLASVPIPSHTKKDLKSNNKNLLHISSSDWSGHSGYPLHWRCPGMQVPSLHMNWSVRQRRSVLEDSSVVTLLSMLPAPSPTLHSSGLSSDPSGQSVSPSQTQVR